MKVLAYDTGSLMTITELPNASFPPPPSYHHIIWSPIYQLPQLKELPWTITKEESLGKSKCNKGDKNKEILAPDIYS